MYTNTNLIEATSQPFFPSAKPSCAAVAASSVRPVSVLPYLDAASGIAALAPSAVAGGVGRGEGVVARRASWVRPRLDDQARGHKAGVKQLIGLPVTGEAQSVTISGGVMTEGAFGLFNPQHHRDFRTWSPPN